MVLLQEKSNYQGVTDELIFSTAKWLTVFVHYFLYDNATLNSNVLLTHLTRGQVKEKSPTNYYNRCERVCSLDFQVSFWERLFVLVAEEAFPLPYDHRLILMVSFSVRFQIESLLFLPLSL